MRVRLTFGVGVLLLAAMVAAAAWGRNASVSEADCTMAKATQLVNQNKLNNFLLAQPVAQVLCGAFTGAGSEAMAVTMKAPTCWSPQGWAVFRFTNGTWELVMVQRLVFVVAPLVAVGSDIRETQPVFRRGDPRCIPSGGTHARVWHWNGTSFTAGPWKQVTKGKVLSRSFYAPSKNITCSLGDSSDLRGVSCMSFKAPQSVHMYADGRLKICHGRRCVPTCGCRPEGIPTLAYGKQITVGRFRCYSLRAGMKCIVIRSGKGFLINRGGVTTVG